MKGRGDARTVVVSHPKSGRTWLRVMLARYIDGSPIETLRDSTRVVPNAGSPGSEPSPKPGIFFSHDPTWFAQVERGVVLLRDPGEILVSYFFHASEHRASGRVSSTLSQFVDSDLGIAALADFFTRVLEHLDDHVTMVTYDELVTDPVRALTCVIDGCGIGPADRPRVVETVAASSLEAMREIEAAQPLNTRFDTDRRNRNRIRAGRADRGRELLSPADREMIRNRLHAEVGPRLADLAASLPDDWAI